MRRVLERRLEGMVGREVEREPADRRRLAAAIARRQEERAGDAQGQPGKRREQPAPRGRRLPAVVVARSVGGEHLLPLFESVSKLETRVADVTQAALGFLAEAATKEVRQPRRSRSRQRVPVGLAIEDPHQGVRCGVGEEGALAGEGLVEAAAEGPDVRSGAAAMTSNLFRAHVRDGARSGAVGADRLRQGRRLVGVRAVSGCGPRQDAGDSEIQDLHRALGRDHHVLGLEVAVGDPAIVRRLQAVGDLDEDSHCFPNRERALTEPLGQGLPLDQLHHQIGDVGPSLEFEQSRDVGVVQGRQHLRLGLELSQPLLAGVPIEADVAVAEPERGHVHPFRQHLDRHFATQLGVAGLVDLTHPSRTEGGDDRVLVQLLTWL